ncbi:MAG TPA: TOMM precursor leader peptide-binding protein [Xanthomonadaceae bacterium]|jgi:bacteriocin biosynthesis cyclodehydratase domain-containing protein|nr:TOMM precursor leader peptide-binding protein [Xanthomonadaceae bacterium]
MPLLALHAGDFGLAVAERVAAADPAALLLPLDAADDALEAAVAVSDFVAVASWRPYLDACRWLDDACHRLGRRWAVVELSGSMLDCGPLIDPGAGTGCYHCYLARTDAHRREGDRRRVLRQAYALDPRLGPQGHTPALVAIAAASLVGHRTSATSGRFRHVDVLSGGVMESELIPLHDCPRCRPHASGRRPDRRYVEALVPALEGALA